VYGHSLGGFAAMVYGARSPGHAVYVVVAFTTVDGQTVSTQTSFTPQ
jgi:pimeloyl-ACP methyl ester carboxylesterase